MTQQVQPEPIPMRLTCEGCGKLHIDEGEFAVKPHHTHSCQFCGLTWRPAVVPTVGVRLIPGFKNFRRGPIPPLVVPPLELFMELLVEKLEDIKSKNETISEKGVVDLLATARLALREHDNQPLAATVGTGGGA